MEDYYNILRKCNLISDADEVARKTELKFKVGDKVKILSDGRIGTIVNIKESPTPYLVSLDDTQGFLGKYFTESDIESIRMKNQTTVNLNTSSNNQLRIMVAAEALNGILSNIGIFKDTKNCIAKYAVDYADALLEEINKK